MSNCVYQSWLTDRGVDPGAGQPRSVLAAGIDPGAMGVIIATSSEPQLESEGAQVQKLAQALAAKEASNFSWILVAKDAPKIPTPVLRNLMPRLGRIVVVDDASAQPSYRVFKTEETQIAGRPVQTFTGPSLSTMNLDASLKSDFWRQLCTWLV